jgi:hypothetical protein
VNPYFPALERTSWINEHINVFDAPVLAPSGQNCMVLLVAALGSLAEDRSIGAPQSAVCQNCMIAAQVMLPVVILGTDMIAVQCMILFSIYYLWIINPPQSHNFISVASMKLQIILSPYLFF